MLLLNGRLTSRRFQGQDPCLFCGQDQGSIEHFRTCPKVADVYTTFGVPHDLTLVHTPPELHRPSLLILHALRIHHLNRRHGAPSPASLPRSIHRHLQADGHYLPFGQQPPRSTHPPPVPSPASLTPRPKRLLQPRNPLPLHHANQAASRTRPRSPSPPLPNRRPRTAPPPPAPPTSHLPRPPEPPLGGRLWCPLCAAAGIMIEVSQCTRH